MNKDARFYAYISMLFAFFSLISIWANWKMVTEINVHTLDFVKKIDTPQNRRWLEENYGVPATIPTATTTEERQEWIEENAPLIDTEQIQ